MDKLSAQQRERVFWEYSKVRKPHDRFFKQVMQDVNIRNSLWTTFH